MSLPTVWHRRQVLEEESELREKIMMLRHIGDERTMYNLMKRESRIVLGNPRLSELQDRANAIEIDASLHQEETHVSVTVLTSFFFLCNSSPLPWQTQHLLISLAWEMLFTAPVPRAVRHPLERNRRTPARPSNNFDTKGGYLWELLIALRSGTHLAATKARSNQVCRA